MEFSNNKAGNQAVIDEVEDSLAHVARMDVISVPAPSRDPFEGIFDQIRRQYLHEHPRGYDSPDVMPVGTETNHEEDDPRGNGWILKSLAKSAKSAFNYAQGNALVVKANMDERKEHRWKIRDEKFEKNAKNPDDPRRLKVKKFLARNALRASVIATTAVGLGALYMTVGRGTNLAFMAEGLFDHHSGVIDIPVEGHEYNLANYESSMLVAGGRGQGSTPPIDELRDKGYTSGVYVEGVEYPAQIAPLDQMRMDDSAAIGSEHMYQQYHDLSASGKPVELVGYSEGSLVAVDAANRIAAENGGVLPSNVHLTLIGSPYTPETGIGEGTFGGVASPFLDVMGIPLDRSLPAGTEVVYFDTDPYANGGNQQLSTLLFDALMLGQGSHGAPDRANTAPAVVFTDSQGVIHKVYSNDQMFVRAIETTLNVKVHDTQSTMQAIDAFFPHAVMPGEEVHPDVRAGLNFTATALDHQIAHDMNVPPESVTIMRDLVNAMPEEWKEVGQSGMDAFNTISETAAKISSGEMDPATGMNIIMDHVNDVISDVQASFPNHEQGYYPIVDAAGSVVSSQAQQYSGMDIRPYVDQFINEIVKPMIDNPPVVDSTPHVATPQLPIIPDVSTIQTPTFNTPAPVIDVPPPAPAPAPVINVPAPAPAPAPAPTWTPEPTPAWTASPPAPPAPAPAPTPIMDTINQWFKPAHDPAPAPTPAPFKMPDIIAPAPTSPAESSLPAFLQN